ncbi:liprin-alpha-2-like isoform X2 [Gordionus sp. m RMFG-2023]|uniref:liprin-alpha-2-like isoform X2 n=1 Tax=Gordionus sp. m RMFG-2023 TaxID=3053472 RepID=UPI0031FCEA9D
MKCIMPTIIEDNISQRGSNFSGDEANFEQIMVNILDERDKLMDSLRENQEILSELQLKYHELEKEKDSLTKQLEADVPHDLISLTKELTQTRDGLMEKEEEISELKAERNNTRLLLEHLECLVSRHERSLRMTVVKRQASSPSGVSSEVEVLKALKSLFEHHKALDEKVREKLRIALEKVVSLEEELNRANQEIHRLKEIKRDTNGHDKLSVMTSPDGTISIVNSDYSIFGNNVLSSECDTPTPKNFSEPSTPVYNKETQLDRDIRDEEEVKTLKEQSAIFQRELRESLAQKHDQEERITTLEKRYLNAQRELTHSKETTEKLKAELINNQASLKQTEDQLKAFKEKLEISEDRLSQFILKAEALPTMEAELAQRLEALSKAQEKQGTSEDRIKRLETQLEETKMELQRGRQREKMNEEHNQRLSETVDKLLSESNERLQSQLKERMNSLEEKNNLSHELDKYKRVVEDMEREKRKMIEEMAKIRSEYEIFNAVGDKNLLMHPYYHFPNSSSNNNEVLYQLNHDEGINTSTHILRRPYNILKQCALYIGDKDQALPHSLNTRECNDGVITDRVNDAFLALGDAALSFQESRKSIYSAMEILSSSPRPSFNIRQDNLDGNIHAVPFSPSSDPRSLAIILQEQLDAINNEIRLIQEEKQYSDLRAEDLESKMIYEIISTDRQNISPSHDHILLSSSSSPPIGSSPGLNIQLSTLTNQSSLQHRCNRTLKARILKPEISENDIYSTINPQEKRSPIYYSDQGIQQSVYSQENRHSPQSMSIETIKQLESGSGQNLIMIGASPSAITSPSASRARLLIMGGAPLIRNNNSDISLTNKSDYLSDALPNPETLKIYKKFVNGDINYSICRENNTSNINSQHDPSNVYLKALPPSSTTNSKKKSLKGSLVNRLFGTGNNSCASQKTITRQGALISSISSAPSIVYTSHHSLTSAHVTMITSFTCSTLPRVMSISSNKLLSTSSSSITNTSGLVPPNHDSSVFSEDPANSPSFSPYHPACPGDYDRRKNKKYELLAEAIKAGTPFALWNGPAIVAWLELWVGMPAWYVAACRANVKSGAVMSALSDAEIQREIGISNPLHRLKLRLAIQEMVGLTDPTTALTLKQPSSCHSNLAYGDMNHEWVGNEWLPSLGLSQYRTSFMECLVDARMLEHLTKKDLRNQLKIVDSFHRTSLQYGIICLKKLNYDRTKLEKLRNEARNSLINSNWLSENLSSNNTKTSSPFTNVLVWTNENIMQWIAMIGLKEYTLNLKDTGVHGTIIALDDSFDLKSLALALQIPQNATARQILEKEFNRLISMCPEKKYEDRHPLSSNYTGGVSHSSPYDHILHSSGVEEGNYYHHVNHYANHVNYPEHGNHSSHKIEDRTIKSALAYYNPAFSMRVSEENSSEDN